MFTASTLSLVFSLARKSLEGIWICTMLCKCVYVVTLVLVQSKRMLSATVTSLSLPPLTRAGPSQRQQEALGKTNATSKRFQRAKNFRNSCQKMNTKWAVSEAATTLVSSVHSSPTFIRTQNHNQLSSDYDVDQHFCAQVAPDVVKWSNGRSSAPRSRVSCVAAARCATSGHVSLTWRQGLSEGASWNSCALSKCETFE